ncbi:hypothetical protein BGX27_003198 [Mortierella sp. AM989]|nr:hypothetical protein BGX27_003198 [Mortierella sp. AM989]
MRLFPKVRGLFLLQEVESLIIPSVNADYPHEYRDDPVIDCNNPNSNNRKDIQKVADGDINNFNRSWGYKDSENVKRLLK